MALKYLKVGRASLVTTDEQIARIEALVEGEHVDQMLNIVVLKSDVPGLAPVQLMALGCPPDKIREILQVALDGLNHTLGGANTD